MVKLLTTSTKVLKGNKRGYLTAISYLSPALESGKNLCPWHTPGCSKACLGHSSGRLALPWAKNNRLKRSRLFLNDRARYLRQLEVELFDHVELAQSKGLKPAVRLNGSSDIPWEKIIPQLFETFDSLNFYDYTKSKDRVEAFLRGKLPVNYHLTFSQGETPESRNQAKCLSSQGANVAIVFDQIPRKCWGRPVINGEADDLRFLDPKGIIVGLKAKGKALRDRSGFVYRVGQRLQTA